MTPEEDVRRRFRPARGVRPALADSGEDYKAISFWAPAIGYSKPIMEKRMPAEKQE